MLSTYVKWIEALYSHPVLWKSHPRILHDTHFIAWQHLPDDTKAVLTNSSMSTLSWLCELTHPHTQRDCIQLRGLCWGTNSSHCLTHSAMNAQGSRLFNAQLCRDGGWRSQMVAEMLCSEAFITSWNRLGLQHVFKLSTWPKDCDTTIVILLLDYPGTICALA